MANDPSDIQLRGYNIIKNTLTTLSGSAYVAGHVWATPVTGSGSFFTAGGSGIVNSVTLLVPENKTPSVDILLFSNPFTVTGSAQPWNASLADMQNCLGTIRIAASDFINLASGSNGQIATIKNVILPIKNNDDTRNLYIGVLSNNTLTLSTTSSFLTLGLQSR